MATGRSLHIGINEVSSDFPNAPLLKGAENDAQAMHDVAKSRGFEAELIVGHKATYPTVLARLLNAAHASKPGDIFLFTFAGHGSVAVDQNGDEEDNQDEAILLFDLLLFDDELRLKVWPCFKPGVRVLMISDSCHSGSVVALPVTSSVAKKKRGDRELREISGSTRQTHLNEFRRVYHQFLVPVLAPPIDASVLLLAACKDKETTLDDDPNGVFTAAMMKVLRESDPVDYRDLIKKIHTEIGGPQTPVLTPIEPADETFIRQKPFLI